MEKEKKKEDRHTEKTIDDRVVKEKKKEVKTDRQKKDNETFMFRNSTPR
jgi:hypothetical protein